MIKIMRWNKIRAWAGANVKLMVWIEDEKAQVAYIDCKEGLESICEVRIKRHKGMGVHSIDEENLISDILGYNAAAGKGVGMDKIIFIDNSSFCIARCAEIPQFRFRWMQKRAAINKCIMESNISLENYIFKEVEIKKRSDYTDVLVLAIMQKRIDSFNRISKGLGALKTSVYSGAQILFNEAACISSVFEYGTFLYDRGFSVMEMTLEAEGTEFKELQIKDSRQEIKRLKGIFGEKHKIYTNITDFEELKELEDFHAETVSRKFNVDRALIERLSGELL